MNATLGVQLGSIAAGVAWILLLVAPGSRAEDAPQPASTGPAVAARSAAPTTAAPTTVPTTGPAASTVPATSTSPTIPAAQPAPPAAPPTSPRVLSLREILGVRIDRGTTWIAIATVTVVDQTGAPAAGVDVKASWSFGPTAAMCRTDDVGKCSMYQSGLPTDLDEVTIEFSAPHPGSKSVRRAGVN